MSYANYDDIEGQLRAAGFQFERIEIGKRIRCKVEGLTQKGWYSLHEITLDDGQPALIGAYGWWKGAEKFVFNFELRVDREKRKLNAEQAAAFKKRMAEEARRDAEERAKRADRAAAEAQRVWGAYIPDGHCDYLERKGVAAHGLRFAPSGHGTCVVPMHNARGIIRGLQILRGKGRGTKLEKEYFPRGLSTAGLHYLIGIPTTVLLLAEGYATAATLHECSGLPVAVAFDAGNLPKVAEALHKRYPSAHILVCADDDYLSGNAGAKFAEAAALAVGGAWVLPQFPADREGKKLTDFNDLYHFPGGGAVMVRAQVAQAITDAGWINTPPPAGDSTAEGGGENGRRDAVSIMSLDAIVQRFVFIDDDTGDFVFDHWTRAVCRFSKVVKLLPAGQRADDIKRHPVWASRAVYIDQIGFDPAGEDRNIVCNRWDGWPTQPKAGKCELLLDLLRYQCNNEAAQIAEALYQWVLRWLAYPLQHPGAKMHTAIVMHGPQGTGKGRFFETYAKIFGDYGIVLNQGAIEDKFNADWSERKLFILADEIVARQEMHHLKNQLKNFVTGEWVRVNPKNVAAHRERNHMNIVFLSNEKQPLVLENDDRRYCVIWTPPPLGKDFYDELSAEIDAGGVAALHDYLMHLDMGDFKPWTRPPMTVAKAELIELGIESVERFLLEWRRGDVEVDGYPVPFCPCGSGDLYALYLRWCKERGEKFPRSDVQFNASIGKRAGWARLRSSRYPDLQSPTKKITTRFIVPSESDLQRVAESGGIDYRLPEGKSNIVWLSECWIAFHNAIESGGNRDRIAA